jgi:hypothetical protein
MAAYRHHITGQQRKRVVCWSACPNGCCKRCPLANVIGASVPVRNKRSKGGQAASWSSVIDDQRMANGHKNGKRKMKKGTICTKAMDWKGSAATAETFSVYYVTTWFCNESGNIGLVTRVCDCVRHELGASNVIATPRSLGIPLQSAGSLAMRKSKSVENPAGPRAGLSSSAAPRVGDHVRECPAGGLSVSGKTREILRRWEKLPDVSAFSRRWT